MKLADWEKELAEVMPFVKEVRRKLHRHPEVGGEERWTREFLEETLHGFGLKTTRFEDTCCVMTIIAGTRPGKCIAIRADIDALPIQEETGLPFASEIPGRMHACGHAAHMALALGTAKYLSSHREKFAGTVKFFFEAEEETRGGAKLMADQGCLENPRVDWVIGQHMNPRYAAGVFFAKPGFVSGASDEVEITVQPDAENRPDITQYSITCPPLEKIDTAMKLLRTMGFERTIIFCNTKVMCQRLSDDFRRAGIDADCIHGDIPQQKREKTMRTFKDGKLPILIATDVASRGIDVDDVDCVLNYDIPEENEYYIHRIGRTGRAKRKGVAISIIGTLPEQAKLDEIAKYSHYQVQPVRFLEDGTLVEAERKKPQAPTSRRRFRR